MKFSKYESYIIGILICVGVVISYLLPDYTGFPDGYVSDYHRATKRFYTIAKWPLFALGVYFIYLGKTAYKNSTNKNLAFACAWVLLLSWILIMVSVDYSLYTLLDHGQGG